MIASHQTDRVRYAAPDRVPLAIRQAAADALQYIADTPPVAHGRVELLWYFQEQSLSVVYHRYGNLGQRANEQRDEPQSEPSEPASRAVPGLGQAVIAQWTLKTNFS